MSQMRQAELKSDGNRDLMLLGVKANGAVKGRLLVMSLEQRYRNSSDKNTEITYTFPLPFGAVLMAIEVELNGKTLIGEVSPKSTARARYEEAISEGNSSIMLEKNHDGSFTLELGNLMAREECKIMVRYAQVLATEHGQVRLMLPTTIAPRYGNPITQGRLQPHQVPVTDLAAEYPFDITLTLMGEMANTNVGSPSHKTSFYRNKDDLVIKLSQRGYLDRDFILQINNLKNESDALACNDLYEEGQYALMAFFSPQIVSKAAKSMTAKVLVDCSASMAGDSIDAARRALKGIVQGLAKEDKFSLSRFGDSVEHRSRGMWSGTPQAKASAMRWIDNVHANLGGTEMAGALVSTIAISDAGKSDILLITDGEISGIDEVIEVAIKSKHSVFIVAIGASPAEAHLRRLATATGGHCDFVAPGEDVEPAVLRMSTRMRAARATAMRVEWPQSLMLRWDQAVQDYAFESDVFNVCAFANAPPEGSGLTTVKLWGRIDGEEAEVLMAEAPLGLTESSTNILARLTAYAKYQELAGERDLLGTAPTLSKAQDIAVAYQLVTEDTNFILVHDRTAEEKAQEMPEAHKVPQMLAAGWGGTGSVVREPSHLRAFRSGTDSVAFNIPTLNCVSGSPDYSGMTTPSVWRTNRTSAAARVDALSAGGMDDYDIPAFLRKTADFEPEPSSVNAFIRKGIDKLNSMFWKSQTFSGNKRTQATADGYIGITPAGVEKWLSINQESFWPKTYADLRDLGLGLAICEWLEFEIGEGHDETMVVAAFLKVMREFGFVAGSGNQKSAETNRKAAGIGSVSTGHDEVSRAIRAGLKDVTAQTWPLAVVNFPEMATA
jgi:Ca-activated chloride channel family protein